MKLTKIALGVSVGLGAMVAHAADVAMFPYIVEGPAVTTIVTVVDQGDSNTMRYKQDGTPSKPGAYLHWRLHYKAGLAANAAPDNAAECSSSNTDVYLPTKAGAIKTVDLGAKVSGIGGLLFGSSSDTGTYDLARQASTNPLRGVLFVHNSDDQSANYQTGDYQSAYPAIQGEAMVFDFTSGAAWGYKAEVNTNNGHNDATNFSFEHKASNVTGQPIVTFMPSDQVTTKLLVTPVDKWKNGVAEPSAYPDGMLGMDGTDLANGNSLNLSVKVGLRLPGDVGTEASSSTMVAFGRDGGAAITGAVDQVVTCVGAVKIQDLMTSAAQAALANGGYGLLSIMPDSASTNGTPNAIVYKIEEGTGSGFGGTSYKSQFENAVKL